MSQSLRNSLIVLSVVVLASCAAKVTDANRVSSSSAASGVAVESSSQGAAPLRIPQGAGSELAKNQLVLFMNVKNVDQTKEPELRIQEGAIKVANIELESLMPRMKRFKGYAVYNQGAQQMARLLSEAGEMELVPPADLPAPDLYLNVTLTFNSEKAELSGKQKDDAGYTMTSARDYKASLFYSLTDGRGQVLTEVDEASGTIRDKDEKGTPNEIQKKIGEALDPSTNERIYKGGFNPTDPDNQASVVRELVANLQTGLAARLALACPLTAKVTALNPSATRFSLEKGSSNGVFSRGRVVVWVDDGNFSYCLAETEAEPTVDRANLNVVRWNEGDPDALPIITKLKADPSAIKGYRVWGTTTNIPPQETFKPQ